jgi:hypothetical protein
MDIAPAAAGFLFSFQHSNARVVVAESPGSGRLAAGSV